MDTQSIRKTIEEQWDENPLQVIIVGSMAMTAAAKLIDSLSGIVSRRAYARRMR